MTLLAAATLSSRARAETAPFAWRGPDCADSAPLLERRLLELVEARDRARLSGSVAVKRDAGAYGVELSIELDGRSLGSRRFEAKSCSGAAETAAVAASLAVYEGEGEPPGAAESGISPDIWTRRPDPVPDFSRPAPPKPAPEPPLLHPRIGLLAQVELAALPKPALGSALTLELGVGKHWSFGLQGSLTSEQRRALEEPQVVYLSGLGAAARACVAPLQDRTYRLDGCAGARFNQTRGRGEGFDVNRSAKLSWLAPLAGVGISLRAASFLELRWEADGSLPLSRRRFLVNGSEVSQPSRVVGTLRLGAVLRF